MKLPARLSMAQLQEEARTPDGARGLRKERQVMRRGLEEYKRTVDTMNRRAEERRRTAAEFTAYCEGFIHDIGIALGEVEA